MKITDEFITNGIIELYSHPDQVQNIVITGDMCPLTSAAFGLRNGSEDSYDKSIQTLLKNSVAITNLECPLTLASDKTSKTGPCLKGHPSYSDVIASIGMNIISLANNHIYDFGESGLLDTIENCKRSGLDTIGAGENLSEAGNANYVSIGDSQIAFLAGAENEFGIADKDSSGACPIDPLVDTKRVQEAKNNADIVIYIYHGGNEYFEYPNPWMKKYCRYLIEIGADAVICHHSHVMSGVEIYQESPIVYGTGNFYFPWPASRPDSWYTGYLVRLNVFSRRIASIELLPYTQCINNSSTVSLLTGNDKEDILGQIADISSNLSNEEYLKRKWESFCCDRKYAYISSVLQLSGIERRVYARTGKLLFAGKRRKSLLRTLNTIRCESHRIALLESIQLELDRNKC